jgi:uncharacterized protein YlxP (DUF503 family)
MARVVGVATLVLQVPGPASLKDKRSIVQRLTQRVRARFNVAVAEVDTQDRLDTITLGVACVSNEAAHAHAMLEKVASFIENERLDAYLMDYEVEVW